MRLTEEKYLHLAFEITVIAKGIFALLETIGGVVIFFVSKAYLTSTILSITKEELSEDPDDLIARYLIHAAQHLSIGSQRFAAFYLFSHGIIKVALVWGLLREKLWAYPASMVVFGLFIFYQLARFRETHSVELLLLTFLDIIIILLTWHEYKYIKKYRPLSKSRQLPSGL